MADALDTYRRKRDFSRTPEPDGEPGPAGGAPRFVVQQHAARRLHYDFRLEMDGVLRSWSVPKGPSYDPADKRLAVQTEDHPLAYADFEGIIPKGEYGGGTVMLWDRGTWEPLGDAAAGYAEGNLKFRLQGERLQGGWALVRMGGRAGAEGRNWLLIKERDEQADRLRDVTGDAQTSVATGRSMAQIADAAAPAPAMPSEEPPPPPSPAEPAALPATFAPQLATLVERAPHGEDWLFEVKLDGYRLLARRAQADDPPQLLTRNGHDWSERFGAMGEALDAVLPADTLIDGELVALDARGVSDFQALQNALEGGSGTPLYYYAFDLPFYRGHDLRALPLRERKACLQALLQARPHPRVRYSDHLDADGELMQEQACQLGLEGIIAKRAQAPYRSRRSRDWLKIKCQQRQEFVIGGFSAPRGTRTAFGALLVGAYAGKQLRYCGRVGTGFDEATLRQLHARLAPLAQPEPAFEPPPAPAEARGVTWTRPVLVAEISFTAWTAERRLRHPVFVALRDDKPPTQVRLELPAPAPTAPAPAADAAGGGPAPADGAAAATETPRRVRRGGESTIEIAGVRLTHPDRVLYPEQGLTKADLARFYVDIAEHVLPHLRERPLSLLRCPRGKARKCFFQKHMDETLPPGLGRVSVPEKNGRAEYVVVEDIAGLVGLVQLGVLELHPWGSRTDRLEQPDMMTFDLDPDPGLDFTDVIAAAREVRALLLELGLTSFVKTTGGKGLHVVVPLTRRASWDEVKTFARALAGRLSVAAPARYTDSIRKAQRQGRIFIDYLRNGRGATAVAAYTTRARTGAPVATPLRWDELGRLRSGAQYDVGNLRRRLAALREDPWEGFFRQRQSITQAARRAVGLA